MPVTAIAETLEIDATTSIAVSDITLADDGITYVRQIDFYTDDLTVLNRRPVLSVRVFSDAQAPLKLTVPSGVTFAFALLLGGQLLWQLLGTPFLL